MITGGTRGLGKAIGLEFAKTGATVYLTHRRSGFDTQGLIEEYAGQNLPAPHIVRCNVSDTDRTRELMQAIRAECGQLDVIISNVALSKLVYKLDDLRRRPMEKSLAYSAWPLVEMVQIANSTFDSFPRYVIAISSDGAHVCHPNYDLAGVSKAVLETLCRYLALRLKPHGTCVNAIRPGFLDTDSLRASMGEEAFATVFRRQPDMLIDVREVAKVCIALCSGYMDAVKGQVITVDEGWSLVSPAELIGMESKELDTPDQIR